MMKKVDYYYKTELPSVDPNYHVNLLTEIFDTATVYNGGNLFEDIYIPVKLLTSSGLSDTYSYINVGLDSDEIADIYYSQYSGNYLIDVDLKTRVKSIFKKNLGKYLRLLELEGYEYNPLWNVDGEEIKQQLENHGGQETNYGGVTSDKENDFTSFFTEHDVAGFNSPEMRHDSKDTTNGTTGNSIGQTYQEVKFNNTTGQIETLDVNAPTNASASHSKSTGQKSNTVLTHKSAKNIVNGDEVDYVVNASDTAFGTALVGGDRMYLEKYIRHGNIGVTKTTELIESQRDLVKFVILQQFFDDINEVILIGLYGNY